jgi:serine phosphatase RsbU (regulator of sigma subunit)/Tfp pilus assembly protein PilF
LIRMTAQIRFKFLFTTILCCCSVFGLAQSGTIDSLEKELLIVTSKERKAEILEALFSELQFNYSDRALDVAIEYRNLYAGDKETANRNYLQSLNLVGIGYMDLNQNDSALFYFQKVLMISTERKDSLFMSKANNNIGALNANLGNFEGAIEYIKRSAVLDEATGDKDGALVSYVNIGSIFIMLGSNDSARYFLTKGLNVAKENKDHAMVATCYLNLGVFEFKLGNYEQAQINLFGGLEHAEIINDQDLLSRIYHNLAMVSVMMKDYRSGLTYDDLSLIAAEKSGLLSNVVSAELGLARSYENLGRYEESLKHYKTYAILKDSLSELQNESVFIEMQEKFKSEEAYKENEILTQKNKIQNLEIAKNAEEIQNSRIVILSSIVGLALLVVLALTLYNRNIIKQRANQKLQDAYAIIHEKNADILASIDYASKIQEALLPTRENEHFFKDSFFLLRPKDIVSGDFLWYAEVDGKKIMAVVDCTGHGVPGAFMSMIGNTFLHQIVNERGIIVPAQILTELRRNVIRALNQKGDGVNRKDGMDMAVCVLDPVTNQLEFAGANNPLFVVLDGEIKEFKGDKQPVGYFEGLEKSFTNHKISMSSGDCVYLFSDGYADQFGGPKGKKFKYKQLKELLFANHQKPMQTQKSILIQVFDDWKGPLEQIDDVCVVGFRVA